MENSTIKVYVKTNEENFITEITSSIFLQDTTGFIEIDSGRGNKFAHAQNQYLEKTLIDSQLNYNYQLVDGVVMEVKK